jgi:pimeloyl-ACP methyl ester carboxylesterase
LNTFGTQHILERDGCPIHYWLTGSERGPVVAFSHTGFVDHTMFESQVALLAPYYRLLTWDMRGHGLSQPLRGRLSYRDSADDLIGLFDHLGIEKAILVGVSMGGCASQEVVFYYPERVAALVLTGCPCVTMDASQSMALVSRIFLGAARLLPEKILQWQMASLANMYVPSTIPKVQAYIRKSTERIPKPTITSMFRSVLNGFHNEPNYRITQPLLLMHGDHDSSPIRKQAPIWANRESNCRYEVVPGAGHNANQDNPPVFNKLLQEFMVEQTGIKMQ